MREALTANDSVGEKENTAEMRSCTFKILLTVFFLPGFFLFPGNTPFVGATTVSAAESASQNQVVVYQFHRRFRCPSCHELEALIRNTLKTRYPEDLKSGKLAFRVVDLDAEGSEHFPKDYDFFYNTVIVVDVKNGKDVRFKNLEKLWEIYEDKEAASGFLIAEIDEYLK